MKPNIKTAVILTLLGCMRIFSSSLFAQDDISVSSREDEENVFAVILYASGEEMSVFRRGELISYSISRMISSGSPFSRVIWCRPGTTVL